MTKFAWAWGIVCLIAAPLIAQTEAPQTMTTVPDTNHRKTQTLLGSAKLRYIGIAIAPEAQGFMAADGFGGAVGNSVALIFNRRWSLGASGFMSRGFDPKLSDNTGLAMRYAGGGGFLEFTPRPYRMLHLSFPLFVGAGSVRLDSIGARGHDFNWPDRPGHGDGFGRHDDNNREYFWIVQPNVRAELNIARFARLYAGVGYRFAVGPTALDYPNASGGTSTLNTADLSGLTLQTGLKLGFFEFRLKRK